MEDHGPTIRRDVNKRHWGKGRVIGCECDHRFTCRACLDAAIGWWRPK